MKHLLIRVFSVLMIITGLFVHTSEAPQVLPPLVAESMEFVTEASDLKTVGAATLQSPITDYKVQPGDTLTGIATTHGVDAATVAYANGMALNSLLQIGRTLLVPLQKGAVHTVRSGDTLWDIARLYGATVSSITEVNPTLTASALKINQKLLIPGVQPKPTVAQQATSNLFSWPAVGRITSPFGPRWGKLHAGIDLGLKTNTSVRASQAGTVIFAGWSGGYGILVEISHSNGFETRYAHNSRAAVKVGDKVSAGQIIAYSGNTGYSTGPHLHFEIRLRGVAQNPLRYLP